MVYGARKISLIRCPWLWQPVQWTPFLMLHLHPNCVHSLSLIEIIPITSWPSSSWTFMKSRVTSHTFWQDVGFKYIYIYINIQVIACWGTPHVRHYIHNAPNTCLF